MTGKVSKRSRSEKFLAKQHAVLQAATLSLNSNGVRGMTLADVAGHFDMKPTAVAYYFPSKEKLAAACFLRAIEKYRHFIDEAKRGLSLRERIEILIKCHFEFRKQVARGTEHDIARFDDLRALNDPLVTEAYVEMFRHMRTLFLEYLNLDRDKTAVHAHTHILIQTLHASALWLQRFDPSHYDRAAQRTLDILLHGIGSAPYKWEPILLSEMIEVVPEPSEGRETFLRAATRLISEHGYRGASVEMISGELNVTRGAFYHHIDDKDDLVEVCFNRTIDIIRQALDAACKADVDGRAQLISLMYFLVEHQLHGDVPLLRYATTSLPESMRQRIEPKYQRNIMHMGSMICDGIADGSLRAIDVQIAAEILVSRIVAAAELKSWLPTPLSPKATEHFVRPIFEGICAPQHTA